MKMFQIYPYDANNDIIGKRKYTKWISVFLLLFSIGMLIFVGPRWGIDFQGGTEVLVKFNDTVSDEEVREAAEELGLSSPLIQQFGSADENRFMIQTQDVAVVDDEGYDQIMAELEALGDHQMTDPIEEQPDRMEVRYDVAKDEADLRTALENVGLTEVDIQEAGQRDEHRYVLRFQDITGTIESGFAEIFEDRFEALERSESVGPRAGEQLRNDGMIAMVIALVAILIYIWFRFDERYSPGAVAALAHDITIALGLFILLDIEFSLPIVAALLTIIGYSLNDTIVVFDRIRENLDLAGEKSVAEVANEAINQTMSRTLVTSLTTLMAVTAIAVIATGLIEDFALALIVGIIIGTYSSVFVASPVMLLMDGYLKERREMKAMVDLDDDSFDEEGEPGKAF